MTARPTSRRPSRQAARATDADVIIGAASSSVSLSVIDKITQAGVAQISPANTSTAFDTYADSGLYFRTAPSDVLQGQVMASTLIGDGHQNIAILARQDSYGEALAENVQKFFEEQGGTVVVLHSSTRPRRRTTTPRSRPSRPRTPTRSS